MVTDAAKSAPIVGSTAKLPVTIDVRRYDSKGRSTQSSLPKPYCNQASTGQYAAHIPTVRKAGSPDAVGRTSVLGNSPSPGPTLMSSPAARRRWASLFGWKPSGSGGSWKRCVEAKKTAWRKRDLAEGVKWPGPSEVRPSAERSPPVGAREAASSRPPYVARALRPVAPRLPIRPPPGRSRRALSRVAYAHYRRR